jgi:hypothetical protein
MNLKKISTFILLFVISLSVFHEIEFAMYDKKPCDIVEYVSEFSAPADCCDDICEIHCEYHQTYVLTTHDTIAKINVSNFFKLPKNNSYLFKTFSETIKPPIA